MKKLSVNTPHKPNLKKLCPDCRAIRAADMNVRTNKKRRVNGSLSSRTLQPRVSDASGGVYDGITGMNKSGIRPEVRQNVSPLV